MKVPILLITYKRLDTTKKVFASIKNYKPSVLYLFSDGAKSAVNESEKIKTVRTFLKSEIDWDCKVFEFFSDTNLGCKYGPQNAISWFFKHEKMGVILEDDTVPDNSFYAYCEELLLKYEHDLRIWNIGGTKMDIGEITNEHSYRFSRFPHTWGWATWASRWNSHIKTLPQLLVDAESPYLNLLFPNKSIVENWKSKALSSFVNNLDAWDYLWSFRVLLNGGLSTAPNKNLISNIGFGEDATHTFADDSSIIKTEEIKLPLKHPAVILPNIIKDRIFFENYFNWKPLSSKIRPSHIFSVLKSRLK